MQLLLETSPLFQVTKIKCIWGKYIYIEAIQITSSSGMSYTNIYHNDCYLLFTVICFQISYE